MKRFLIFTAAAACLLACTSEAVAQGAQGNLIKQRAKALRDQNNAAQGVPSTPPPQTPAAPAAPAPATPPAGGLSPVAQQNIALLEADLAALKDLPAEQKPQLPKDLMSVVQGAKPGQDSVNKLATDLQQGLAGKNLPPDARARLARELNAAVNGINLSPAQIKALASDLQAILQAAGVSISDATGAADDFKAIVAEVKKAAGK